MSLNRINAPSALETLNHPSAPRDVLWMPVFLTRAIKKQGSNCWKNGKSSILGIPPSAPDVEEMGEKEVKGISPIRQMVGP